jgi:TolB-like protein
VLDTPEWLPVAVVTLTSSFSEPFWNRFPDAVRDDFLTEMKRYCRKAAKELLRGRP